MKYQTFFVVTFLAVAFAFSVPSRADSDGYFCSSKGYLAYELREGITPGVVGHVLRVVRFDSEHGIRSAGEVILQDFQVHMMACGEDRIQIAGFRTVRSGDPPLTKCIIEIGGSRKEVSILECTDDATLGQDWRKELGPEPPNLGQWARTKRIPLESPDPDHEYYLLLDFASKKVGEYDVEVHHKTELTQADAQRNVSQRFVVYETRIVVASVAD